MQKAFFVFMLLIIASFSFRIRGAHQAADTTHDFRVRGAHQAADTTHDFRVRGAH